MNEKELDVFWKAFNIGLGNWVNNIEKKAQQDALIKIKGMIKKIKGMIKEKVSLNGYNIETVNYEDILEIVDNLLEEAKQ